MGCWGSKSYPSFALWNEEDAVFQRPTKLLTTGVTEVTGETFTFLLPCHPGLFEFVAFFPGDLGGLVGGFPTESEAEAGHGGVGGVVHARMVFITGLVVVVFGVVGVLGEAPSLVVVLEFHPFVDRERRDTDACEAEVVGAVEVSGFGAGVGTDRESELGCQRLNDRIETGPLSAGYFNFFGRT